MRLLLADLRHHASSWVWTLAVATTCAAALGAQLRILHGSLATASTVGEASVAEAAGAITGWVMASVILTAVPILSSTISQSLEQRTRDHGLWEALGIRPGMVVTIVSAQTGVLGALGGGLGLLLAIPLAQVVLRLMVEQRAALPGTAAETIASDVPTVIGCTVAVCLLGGFRCARATTRTPVSALLRNQLVPGRVRRWVAAGLRLTAAMGLVAALVSTATATPSDQSSAVNLAVAGSFISLALIIVLTAWLAPSLQYLIGSVVPKAGASWFVATRTCAVESRRSSATVLPFTIAIGLVGTLFSMRAVGASGVSPSGFLAMFGLALLVAWVGGIGIIAMASGRRQRDAALLIASGARIRQVRLAEVLEGIVHTATAATLGVGTTVMSLGYMGSTLGLSVTSVLPRGPWTEVDVVTAASLAVICTAIVLSSRGSHESEPATQLRGAE